MDVNLQFWRSEGKTFLQRFNLWLDILDPLLLFKTSKEIEKATTLLLFSEPDITKSLQNKKIKEAWRLNLASLNAATGDIILSIFRPPAFLPLSSPLILGILLPHKGVRRAFSWQFLFHTYISGFSVAHGNVTQDSKEPPYMQILFGSGAILFSASMGAFSQYTMTRHQVQSPSRQLLKIVLPGPLTAALCALNVLVFRANEFQSGINIMDSEGNIIGVSKKAGEKAVTETALSRAGMIGTAVCIPDIILHFVKRTHVFVQNPHLLLPLKYAMAVSIFGLMIPISFSWIPQFGTIQRGLIEPEIISSTEETEFFYNRGL